MNKEEIMNKIQLYEFCENMEELYDDYYVPLQQENKDLKEEIKKLQRIVISKQEDYLTISVGEITKVFKLNDNKKWVNEVGDNNEK